MEDSKARFMGGHYDSTKQMRVFRNSVNKLSKDLYKADKAYYSKTKIRLMLDILFSRTVVLTYAQFMDGFFYHRLVQNYYQDSFVEALKNDTRAMGQLLQPMIELRIWPNEQDLQSTMYTWMIRKESFLFSSLEAYQPGLSNRFHRFAHDYFKDVSKIDLSDPGFAKEIERSFGDKEENRDMHNWLESLNAMQQQIPAYYTKKWERDYNTCLMLAKDTYTEQYPETTAYLDALGQKYPSEEMQVMFDKIKNDLDDNGIIPERSKILDLLKASKLEEEEKDKIQGMYNNLYNKAMAIQHKCQLCDEGINTKVSKRADKLVDKLSTRILDILGDMSWIRYFQLMRDLRGLRENLWFSDPDEFEHNARLLIHEFIRCIDAEHNTSSLLSKMVATFVPSIAGGGLNLVVQYLTNVNLTLTPIVFEQLILFLVNLGFRGEHARQLAKQLDDACTLVKYATNNMLGGGSDPCSEEANYLAWTVKQAGTVADDIEPIAVVASESYAKEDGELNSIYRGNA